jgi:hypothetical protein
MEGSLERSENVDDVLGDAVGQITAVVERGDASSLIEVLDARLSKEITPLTFEELRNALSVYLEPNALAFLTWLSQPMSSDSGTRIRGLETSDEVADFLRSVVGRFGPELSRASYAAAQPLPYKDDWRGFNRQILRDLETGETIVRLTLKKQNGEIFDIEGGVPSMVRFARNAIRTLSLIEDDTEFPEKDVARLVEAWEELSPRLPRADAQVDKASGS